MRAWPRPRSTRTSRRRACGPPTRRPTRAPGRHAKPPRDRRHAGAPGPGLIVTGAFFAARLLGWLRLLDHLGVFPGRAPVSTASSPRSRSPTSSSSSSRPARCHRPHPDHRRPPREERGRRAWRVASTVANLMLATLVVLAVVVFIVAPWDHPCRDARLRRCGAGPHHHLSADHAPEPALPRARGGGLERPQRASPRSAPGGRADRLQPRDHRRGGSSSRRSSGIDGSPSAWSWGRCSTSSSSFGRSSGRRVPVRPPRRPRRCRRARQTLTS